jgi:hypothetical protein
LKVQSLKQGGTLIVDPNTSSPIAAVVSQKPATAMDALNFVADFQAKSERDFLASNDISSLKGLSPTQYEDILIKQYEKNQYSLTETLNMMLSANGLMLETPIPQLGPGIKMEDLFLY